MTDRTETDVARIVADGYDRLGTTYRTWADAAGADPRDRWLERLERDLRDGGDLLELGCGDGLPTARHLASRFAITGIDISAGQIGRARLNVPTGRFRVADMA